MKLISMAKLTILAMALVLAPAADAQSIVSARSGAIHHLEGDAFIDDQAVAVEFAEFPNLAEGSVLRTELGRAEMLLTPGVIARLGEDSAVKMISSRLTDTRLEVLQGSLLVEVMELLDGNSINLICREASITLEDAGLYRVDAAAEELRVYRGKAQVRKGDQVLTAKKNRVVEFGDYLVAAKFDSGEGDSLYRWSARRSGYLSMANLSAARTIDRWGMPWTSSGWRWNPYFGMFTFIPAYGMAYSPFGYSFWSPRRIYMVYEPPRPTPTLMPDGRMGSYSPSHGYVVTQGRTATAPSPGPSVSAPSASPRTSGGATVGSPRGSSGGR